MNQPLLPIDNLLPVSPRSLRISVGLPHPLAKFGIAGQFEGGLYADIVLYFIHEMMIEEPESHRFNAATWFLLESEKAYFLVCAEAGIDAARLREAVQRPEMLWPLGLQVGLDGGRAIVARFTL